MPFAPVNGIDLYYEVHGPAAEESAGVIVFAHGAGGSHLSWWRQVPHFAVKYTCVTFDHRGYGQSLDAPDGPGGAAYAEDLRGLLDHLGITSANLVAQSMGGWTCLGFALKYPGRVRRLVMADTHGGLTSPEIMGALMAAMQNRPELPPGVHPAAGARMASERPELSFLYAQLDALNRPRTQPELLAILAAAGSPSAEEVAKLAAPVLFIAGDEDVVIPPAVIEAAAACVPGARLERVPEAGHSVYFERPGRFNQLVEEFLA